MKGLPSHFRIVRLGILTNTSSMISGALRLLSDRSNTLRAHARAQGHGGPQQDGGMARTPPPTVNNELQSKGHGGGGGGESASGLRPPKALHCANCPRKKCRIGYVYADTLALGGGGGLKRLVEQQGRKRGRIETIINSKNKNMGRQSALRGAKGAPKLACAYGGSRTPISQRPPPPPLASGDGGCEHAYTLPLPSLPPPPRRPVLQTVVVFVPGLFQLHPIMIAHGVIPIQFVHLMHVRQGEAWGVALHPPRLCYVRA